VRRSFLFSIACAGVVVPAIVTLVAIRGPAPPRPPVPASIDTMEPGVAEAIRQALDGLNHSPRDSDRWFALGLTYEGNEIVPEALECHERAAHLDPSNPRPLYHAALLRANLGDMDGAIAAMERMTGLEARYAPAWWRLGQWRLERGELDAAAAAFERAARADPHDPGGAFGLARVELARGYPARCIEIVQPLAAGAGQHARHANMILARALQREGRVDEAAAALARGGGAEPELADPWQQEALIQGRGIGALLNRALAIASAGNLTLAMDLLLDLRRRVPGDPAILNNIGILHRLAGRLDESDAVLREAIALRPEFAPARFSLAATLAAQAGQAARPDQQAPLRRQAMEQLDAALRANPAMAEAYAMRSELLEAGGDDGGALAAIEEAVRREPGNPWWVLRAALLHLRAGRLAEAESGLNRAAALAPTMPPLREAYKQLETARGTMLPRPPEARP
jgi:tetratricopeptide (TPR) repeat protein